MRASVAERKNAWGGGIGGWKRMAFRRAGSSLDLATKGRDDIDVTKLSAKDRIKAERLMLLEKVGITARGVLS